MTELHHDWVPFSDYLQALADQLSTADACEALGLSRGSFNTLKKLYAAYFIVQPERVNQYAKKDSVEPDTFEGTSFPAIRVAKARPADVETVVILPDIHGHLVDPAAFGVALGYITENDVDEVIVDGDGVDMEAISSFSKTLRVRGALGDEIEYGRGIRQAIDEAAGDARKRWLKGNHEDRLDRFLLKFGPELLELPEDVKPTVPNLLKLAENGWKYVDDKRYLYVGSVAVGHFDLVRKQPGTAAQILMHDRNESVLQAHTHKIGGGVKRFPDGTTLMGYEIGCLCKLEGVDYIDDPTWSHGFAILRRIRGSARFDFHQVNICGGEAVIDEVRYTA